MLAGTAKNLAAAFTPMGRMITGLFCILTVVGLSGCFQADSDSANLEQSNALRKSCIVKRVYDGDTLICDLNGNGRIDKPVEKIRLLGINAPETVYGLRTRGNENASRGEPMADEATDYLTTAVEGQRIWLEMDVNPQDRYGRTLAFIYLSAAPNGVDESVNALLLEKGLASSLFIGENRRYQREFEHIEAGAHHARLGVWAPQ